MHMIQGMYCYLEKMWFKWPQKLRFLLVGGFNTVFAYMLLNFLNISFLWMWPDASKVLLANIALFVQYLISINVSFMTMRYYVFQSRGKFVKECLKAWSVYIFLYLINAPVLTFLMVQLKWDVWFAQAVYLILSTILTFVLHKYYSFRESTER